MTQRALFMEPADVWSFRDGKPFEAGEAFDAASLFPPSPWTTLGCIRTALLRHECPDVERYAGRPRSASCPRCGDGPCAAIGLVGEAGGPAPFAVGPPLPASRTADGRLHVLYPTPADLVEFAEDESAGTTLLAPLDVPPGIDHSLVGLRPVGVGRRGRVRPPGRRWMTAAQLAESLAGRRPQLAPGGDDWLRSEPRIGIGMDNLRNTANSGQLYVREVVRLGEGYGLAVSADVAPGLDGEIGRLGGDGRMVRFRDAAAPPPPALPSGIDRRFKVYLAAPAWFGGGRLPAFLDGGEGTWPGTGVRVRLVGCALAAASGVGGWDLKRQAPRPMRRVVGSGSIYFFEAIDGGAAEVAARLHGNTFCDDPDMARAGFGLAFAGRW